MRKIFTRSVGNEIPLTTAEIWKQRYRHQSAARIEICTISALHLNQLLATVPEILGVNFHYGLDSNGQQHILIAPVDENLNSWTNGNILDATNDKFIDAVTAKNWAESYKENNVEGPWSNYFGLNIFSQIVSKNGLTKVDVVPGINDGNVRHLLLYVFYSTTATGRSMNSEVNVYDGSAVCPPTCAENL